MVSGLAWAVVGFLCESIIMMTIRRMRMFMIKIMIIMMDMMMLDGLASRLAVLIS